MLKTNEETYYVVMKISRWENLELEQGLINQLPLQIQINDGPSGMCGFLPVYTNREDAVRFAGDEEYVVAVRPTDL